MTRSSTGALKLLTLAGLLSADCDMCLTGAEVEYIKFFVSLDAPFFCLCSGHCQAKFSIEILPNLLSILVTTLNDL